MNIKILYCFLILTIFFVFYSCELPPVSIEERVNLFEEELNKGSGRKLYENFHTDMTGYDNYKDDTNFDGAAFDKNDTPFSITLGGSATDQGSGVMYQEGNITSINIDSAIKFYFKQEDGEDWYILAVRVEDTDYNVGSWPPI